MDNETKFERGFRMEPAAKGGAALMRLWVRRDDCVVSLLVNTGLVVSPGYNGFEYAHQPLAVDLGWHAKPEVGSGLFSRMETCDLLDDGPCDYDGTSLGARSAARLLVEEGSEALYAELERDWEDRFGTDSE